VLSTTDTIVAVATPAGHGGIGIVRLSGPTAPTIAQQLAGRSSPFQPRHATLATLVDRSTHEVIDQVVVTWFQAPASYTGEEVIEIGAHGSPVVLREIVRCAMREGARLAEPGEFTFRAYLNGRLDLVQAEAVADLIEAVTPLQARAAADQLNGTLTNLIAGIDADLFDLAARLEASLDFPDEGFHFITRDEARESLDAVAGKLAALIRDGQRGRIIRDGATVVIAGRPNAGKSSLFNALAGADRAIVADVPGTTRDVLTERIDLDGLAVTLVDTAGQREALDVVEAEGVRRARQAQDVASLVVWVIDGSTPVTADDRQWESLAPDSRLVVLSKSDLGPPDSNARSSVPADALRVSVRTGEGLDRLRHRIVECLTGSEVRGDTPALSNLRHLALVERASASVARACDGLASGATEELVLAELGDGRAALEEIVGRRTPDDLLRHIFSRFCIGK
jgi:tRNA modification GTPase